jgi:RHS repeat-associated protein
LDIIGDLPVILLELDSSNNIQKTYIYANSQIIAQHDGDHTASRYFYLHDRLGSVRQVIDTSGAVVKYYTFEPFGQALESGGTFDNSFMFTGQWFDSEIDEYHLRARQYDPYIYRFTSRDPADIMFFQKPLTFHKYLYCGNNPLNMVDPTGLWTLYLTGTAMGSFGWSGVRQSGIVIDDDGNVGWINITGGGAGSPAAGLGGSVGWTNADTIFDIQGTGLTLGGSYIGLGGEYIMGKQRSGELYHGVEFTWMPVGTEIPEIHVQVTHTTVYESDINWREVSEKMEEGLLESALRAETVGEAYGLLFIWGLLE